MSERQRQQWESGSGIPLKSWYGPDDVPEGMRPIIEEAPGEGTYTRAAYPTGYRSKPWRIFQLSGYGNPEDEAARIKFLLEHGETGFIMEHDRNTADHLYNVDHPEVVARREDAGLTGAVIQSIRDFEVVLDGLPLQDLYAHPGGGVVQHGPFALANYWAIASRRGLDLGKLSGTGQSDFFLTYLGCITKQQVPTDAGLRFNADIIEFCAERLPHWVPVSIAAYNGAETGLNSVQEIGALFANAVEYLDEVQRRGNVPLDVAAKGVGGISFRVDMDIFESACKLRAGRKIWSNLLRQRYGVNDPKALRLRVHSLTAGSAMTYPQPLNNLVRGTVMALAGALGGTQSMGVSGYDEALTIPSDHAHQMSLRIQQILQNETNIDAVVDPLGGSHYVEALTGELYERGCEFMDEIEAEGGFLATLDSGWLHQRAQDTVHREVQQQLAGERVVVGVDLHTDDASPFEIEGFRGSSDAYEKSLARLDELRTTRDATRALESLRELERVCRSDENIMPAMIEAVDAEVSMGEVGDVFREVFGDWESPIAV